MYPERVAPGEVLIQAGKITGLGKGVAKKAERVLFLDSLYVAPGFLDIQANGALGYDFLSASEKEISAILDFFVQHGTTGLLATLTSAPPEVLHAALRRLKSLAHPALLGVHLEGPFLAEARCGAHPREYLLPPSLEFVRALLSDFGEIVKIWTLAPELPGAEKVVEELKNRGVLVAFGHSEASYEEGLRALSLGPSLITHLFNGMRPFHHREPGLVAAALESPLFLSLICDGAHVHPATVRLVTKLAGFSRLILVTDAVAPTGFPDGEYPLFGQRVRVENGVPTLPGGILAGTTLTINRAVRNFAAFTGCALPEAVRCATLNPAQLLGIEERKGSLALGKDADLVVFDEEFTVHYTILGGRIVYQRD